MIGSPFTSAITETRCDASALVLEIEKIANIHINDMIAEAIRDEGVNLR